ncbi:MAG: ATP-binding protein [Clostridiales bacterium]|nr:ATP-binding protein [Clostridiales bacterium]
MKNEIFNFSEYEYIGQVINIETSLLVVKVLAETITKRFSVGHLLSIVNEDEDTAFIGIVNKVFFETDKDNVQHFYIALNLFGTFYEHYKGQINVYKRGVNIFPTIKSSCYLIEKQNLYQLMELVSYEIDVDDQLVIGKFALEEKAKAILNGDIFFQRHASILGSTGAGKSWCVANILQQANKLNFPNIIVFDIHGEYKPLTKGKNRVARRYKIAGPGDKSLNKESTIYLPYWLLKMNEFIALVIDKDNDNSDVQSLRLTTHIERLKEKTLKNLNKKEVQSTFTIDSPIPYEITDLVRNLNIDNSKKGYSGATGSTTLGTYEGKLTDLVNTLRSKMSDKRYAFLFNPHEKTKNYEWLGQFMTNLLGVSDTNETIKIIDFSEVPTDILPIITGKLVSLIYAVQFWMDRDKRTPLNIICDEAHLYLPEVKDNDLLKSSLRNFEKISKEGRKYSISLTVVSQRPYDVSRTILSQCNNYIALRLTNDRDREMVKSLIPEALEGIVDMLPLLGIGEAMVFGDAILMPGKILLDIPVIKPDSNTRNYWVEWNEKKPKNDHIVKAVEIFRRQTRGFTESSQIVQEKKKTSDFI